MTASVPTTEPREIRAGMTWAWRRDDLSDYPAPTWTLTYWFKQAAPAGAKFSVVATADGAAHAVSVAASTTAGYTADDYTWVAVASSGTESYEVDRGTARLLPKYNADAALDDRSHAKKTLEAIEAVIENRATLDQQEYTIGSRSLKRMTVADLLALRDKYRGEVWAEEQGERARNGQGSGRLVVRLK
jgi:hypothetical protein